MNNKNIKIDTLIDIYNKSNKSNISIICHDDPDPDCMASAFALREMYASKDIKADIYYGGEITHTQNRVLINALGIPLNKIKDIEDEEDNSSIINDINNSFIILVDTSNFKSKNCQSVKNIINDGVYPDLIIDHHEYNNEISKNVKDYISIQYASCSSIIYEICKNSSFELSSIANTALFFGIITDTDDLKSEFVTDNDKIYHKELSEKIDIELYLKILHYPKSNALIGLRKNLYNSLWISSSGNLCIANVGLISPQQRALIADLCDELTHLESIETAIVMALVDFGQKEDKYLVASFRSSGLQIDANQFMQSVFGKKNAGGRKGAAAAKIKIDETLAVVIDQFSYNNNQEENNRLMNDYIFTAYKNLIISEKEKM